MKITTKRKAETVLIIAGFILTGICAGAFIYMADEGRNTLDGIFRPGYFIPVAMYSVGVVAITYLIYHFIKKRVTRVVAFILAVITGIPLGLFLLCHLVRLCLYLYNWIDIIINT